jgi:FixJ family two-component response regulator
MTRRASPALASRAKASHDASHCEPPIIAVVDDDEYMREAIADLLAAAGYRTKVFESAEHFLAGLVVSGASCLVSDMNMPGMSGSELYVHLLKVGQAIPTILVTAYPDERTRLRCLSVGVHCYLEKPLKDHVLLDCIRRALLAGNFPT